MLGALDAVLWNQIWKGKGLVEDKWKNLSVPQNLLSSPLVLKTKWCRPSPIKLEKSLLMSVADSKRNNRKVSNLTQFQFTTNSWEA